jgi:hypothetical protein
LYSTHAALPQNKAKHIDPIINFIIFMPHSSVRYLMSTEMIWFYISTRLVGMQEPFLSPPTSDRNGEVWYFWIGRASRVLLSTGPPKQSCLVDYSLEIAAVKKVRDREDAITERETRALPRRRDRERQLDPASLLLWLLWCN